MIGISVGDIIKLLEKIPVWKTLTELPKQVRDLEARVAALEKKPTPAHKACPLCGAELKTTKVAHDPIFGPMGLQMHTLVCSACPHSEERQVDPSAQTR